MSDCRCITQTAVSICRFVITVVSVCLMQVGATCYAVSDEEFFEARIRPLLVKHCVACHGDKKQEGGLRLDSRDGWMRGGIAA